MRNLLITLLALSLIFAAITGCDREVTETIIVENSDEDCFVCHGDDGLLLQAKGEWQSSVHASGTNVDYTNRGGSDCTECHNHNGFLEFLETGSVSAPYDNVSAIHCFTCHAPHERGDLSLRTTDPVELTSGETFDAGDEGNLCVNCHRARRGPESITDNFEVTSSHWGPHHGPQGDLLIGQLGYEFSGYSYVSTGHANAVDKTCATCHMGDPRQHSGYGVGGHSFNIVDDDDNSIVGVCSECHVAADDEIDFLADDDFDYDGTIEGVQTEMEGLADSLFVLLFDKSVVDADGHPIRGTIIAEADLAGALWNYLTYEEDRSKGIHNYRYILGLLQSSIEVVNAL
jgi:hypothetical protein